MLVVIDGAKALRKAVGEVFGKNALVQRCRIHKRRNVLDYLREEHQQQVSLRLRAAWSAPDAKKAAAELRKIVGCLRTTPENSLFQLSQGHSLPRVMLGVPKSHGRYRSPPLVELNTRWLAPYSGTVRQKEDVDLPYAYSVLE